MRPPPRALACALLLLAIALAPARAQTSRDATVDLSATPSATSPYLTLNWSLRFPANISGQSIYRRLKGDTNWGAATTLTTSQTSYVDSTALPNVEYEYKFQRTFTGLTNPSLSQAHGYLNAGVQVPFVEDRGIILLVIDDTMVAPLAPEIAQLKADMTADGWTVQTIVAPRAGTSISTRALIKTAYDANPTGIKLVYLLGQVPVPYSGQLAPDGHTDHVGAWPYDGYYADMNGTWTDSTVTTSSSTTRTQNQNVPGDGKFDQSTVQGLLELGVGRVHLARMTKAPNANVSETALLRRYLRKAHDYRYQLGAYANVPRRTLIRDGFGYFGGEAFAVSGWSWAYSSVGNPPFAPVVDEPPSGAWWNYAGANTYLLGYGCGGGSYESASSMGNSTDFGRKASRVVFMSLFGSYHGDWDADNNFMRSVLAGNASGDSLGLCCFWGGRPAWVMHWTGMGTPLGLAARNTMNTSVTGGGGYTLTGLGSSIVQGLMGDPTLRLHMVQPPRDLTAVSSNGAVMLAWSASTETALQGYHVYRAGDPAGPYTRLTAAPLTGITTYVDSTATTGQPAAYMVRTLKLETVPGGSYYNLSQGSLATLTVSAGGTPPPRGPTGLTVTQTSAVTAQLAWRDNASDETGFRIERKVNATGSYATLATPGANATGFTDPGPFIAGNVYYYRVFATGAGGDSLASEEVSFDAVSGFFDFSQLRVKVSKAAGTVAIPVNRFGGLTGRVVVEYSTTDVSAVAGVHYQSATGTLVWPDGDTAPKNIFIPIVNDNAPHLPRQFTINLANPAGGGTLAQLPSVSVLIEDPSASLSAGWTSANIGTLTDASPAVEAEGAIGGATIAGTDLASGDTADGGQFAYQQFTGDAQMTAFVPAATPNQTGARFAVMARESTASNSMLAAAITSGDPATYGAKLGTRSVAGNSLSAVPSTSNPDATPRWLRLTRFGNTFTAESSTDGRNWNLISAPATVNLSSTALWGLYHSSDDVFSSSGNGNYQLGAFTNVSIRPLGAPDAPSAFSAVYAVGNTPYVNLTWTTARYISGYTIERRAEGQGVWTQIATPSPSATSFADTTIAPDTSYEYRLTAVNGAGNSAKQPIARVTTAPADATLSIPALADAAVQAANPGGTFGTQSTLTVCGSDVTNATNFTPVVKSWLRFDLSAAPPIKTAKLKIGITSTDLAATFAASQTFASRLSLLQESSDTWDETALSWSNAPQNDTAGLLLTGASSKAGTYSIASAGATPANNSVVSIPLSASLLYNGRGPNGLVTLAFIPTGQCGPVNFASHESTGLAGPVLEVTYATSLPRPSFLTATPAAASGLALTWLDNAATETGFALERRVVGGSFAPLQTFAANTTSFVDTTTTPGVSYEYRIKTTGVPGDSTWALSAAATAPAASFTSWLQQNGLQGEVSAAAAPDACPKGDGYSNLFKAALGLSLDTLGHGGHLRYSRVTDGGNDYLAVTLTRPEPPPSDIVYVVEVSSNLTDWNSITPTEMNATVTNGLKTLTLRDIAPIKPGTQRYLRLRVSLP